MSSPSPLRESPLIRANPLPYVLTVPLHKLQSTSSAVPSANPTPELPKKASAAPLSLHRSKLTFAPYWFVSLRLPCEHSGLPSAGHRLLTWTMTDVPALERGWPLLSVSPVMRQHVPQPGPWPCRVISGDTRQLLDREGETRGCAGE